MSAILKTQIEKITSLTEEEFQYVLLHFTLKKI